MNQSDISATGLFGNTLSDLKLAFVIVGDTLVITDWFHDLGALFQALFKGFLDSKCFIEANSIMYYGEVSSAGLFGNALSDLKLAFVIVSDALVIANW